MFTSFLPTSKRLQLELGKPAVQHEAKPAVGRVQNRKPNKARNHMPCQELPETLRGRHSGWIVELEDPWLSERISTDSRYCLQGPCKNKTTSGNGVKMPRAERGMPRYDARLESK